LLFVIKTNVFSSNLLVPGLGFKVQGLQPMEAAHDIDQDPEYPA
jgi:hypothetical protein